jgi:hypothetical protein
MRATASSITTANYSPPHTAEFVLMSRLLIAALALVPAAFADDDALKPVLELQKVGKLLNKADYPAVRAAAANAFATRHADDIKAAFGDDHSGLTDWLAKRKDIREEFFSAIHETKDEIPAVLETFRALWKADAAAVEKYPNLAIAVSVVWDAPGHLYDYRPHQVRTKSILPKDYLKFGALDEFKYHVGHAKEVQAKEAANRLEVLPWEFLVYVVDHRTPVAEREWAIKNYLTKRPLVGKIYHEIKYDDEMLRTRSEVCALNDHDYTLPDIRKYGGVCAMQADFAARVGKSLGVPAAYIRGEASGGERHAWVMWVEVRSMSKARLEFSLESWGRYREDNYYTGEVVDPQTGAEILDRDLERRLGTVATDRVGKRQADLVMESYDGIAKANNFDPKKKIQFLTDVLNKLSPVNEAAWLELARMARDGETTPENKKAILDQANRLVMVFAKYPDFSWKVAPDMLAVQPDKLSRNRFYESLVVLYERAERPDLASQARLKWAEFLGEEKKWTLAAQGLTQTIKKFPNEGRYIPKLVDELKKVCGEFGGGTNHMAKTYVELVRLMNPHRGDEITKYYSKMSREALDYLRLEKKKKEADEVEKLMRAAGIKDL